MKRQETQIGTRMDIVVMLLLMIGSVIAILGSLELTKETQKMQKETMICKNESIFLQNQQECVRGCKIMFDKIKGNGSNAIGIGEAWVDRCYEYCIKD